MAMHIQYQSPVLPHALHVGIMQVCHVDVADQNSPDNRMYKRYLYSHTQQAPVPIPQVPKLSPLNK